MTTLTIKKDIELDKSIFENFNELCNYVLEKYLDFQFISYNDLSEKEKENYNKSKLLKKEDLIDI